MDAIAAAQVLSEIGYLLRQDPKEVYRARAFSAAAWAPSSLPVISTTPIAAGPEA